MLVQMCCITYKLSYQASWLSVRCASTLAN